MSVTSDDDGRDELGATEVGEAGESSPTGDVDDVHQVRTERDDYLETLRRLQADFENYRKRVLREQTALVERATEGLVEQLLPALDAFQLALVSIENDDTVSEQVRKGVELVYADLLGVLERNGVERIDALGHEFDPNQHEGVLQVERAHHEPPGPPVVVDVVRAGWKLKGRVVRPAMVKVLH